MKVALYGRVSTDEQKENQTINNQKRELDKYIKNNGYKIYDYYLDEGVSGSIPFEDRTEGRRLLLDAKDKKFDLVIVLKTDRLGRNLKVMLNTVDAFSKLNIGFKSISEPYNTQTPEGKMMFSVISSFSEYDWNNIQRNSMRGKERAIDEGRWIGGVPPYGYVVNKEIKKLEMYDEKVLLGKYSEVDIIKKIYELCSLRKLSCAKIAEKLNSEGIPPYTEGKNKLKRKKARYWIGERIRNLIKDETYKGEKIIGKRAKKDGLNKVIKVSPIVSTDVWEKAQDVLKSNMIQSLRNTKRHYLLTGKIKCSKCGRNFTGLANYNITYYSCNNYRLKNKKNPSKCFNKFIRADVIENEIWDDLKQFINNPITIKNFLHQKLSGVTRIDVKKELKAIDYKIKKLDKKREKIIDLLCDSDDCLVIDLRIRIKKIENEKEKLLEERKYNEELSKKDEFEKRKISEIERVLCLFNKKIENPDSKLKKEIINILVDKVIVHPYKEGDDKRLVEIQYSFKKTGNVITKLSLKH